MSTDLLRIEPNERVDYTDFAYMLDESMTAAMRDVGNNFFLDPGGAAADRMRIIDGFEMSNPAAKQLTVTRGRAILAERVAGVVQYGALVSEGEASQTVDLGPLASATYGVYIRFEYVDAVSGSRVFWNPSGAGSEFTQNISTRRQANWSIRVEVASPGVEWLQIGTADNSGGSLVLVDLRDLYFEGPVASSYQSGWSTEGGGSASDRNADRQQYGVKDLQTFTDAMRQCLEDIRGRGLRRWYEKGIGGLNIGFDTDPTEDQLHVADSDFGLEFDGTDPHLVFDDDRRDEIWFDRSAENYYFKIDAVNRMILTDDGLQVANGIRTGSTGTPFDDDFHAPGGGINCGGSVNPTLGDGIFVSGVTVGYDGTVSDDALKVGDTNFRLEWISSTETRLQFDADDGIYFDRDGGDGSVGEFQIVIDGTVEALWDRTGLSIGDGGLRIGSTTSAAATGDGIFIGGLVVGYDGAPTADEIRIGADTFRLNYNSGLPEVIFDNTVNTKIDMGSAGDLEFLIAGSAEAYVNSSGISIENGLFVGDATIAATSNEIRCQGDLHVGGRQIYFGIASNDYIDFNDTENDMIFYIDGTGVARISSNGLNVTNGLYVGNNTTDPTDNDIEAQADIIAGNYVASAGRRFVFGALTADDYIAYNDTNDDLDFVMDGGVEYRFSKTGIDLNSNALTECGSIDGTGDITMGSITMTGFSVDADGDTSVKTLTATLAASAGGDLIAIGTNDAGAGQVGLGWDTDDQPVIWWDLARDDVWEWDQGSDVWRFKIEGTTEFEFTQSKFDAQDNLIATDGQIQGRWHTTTGTSPYFSLNEAGKDTFQMRLGSAGNGLEFYNSSDVRLGLRVADIGDVFIPNGGLGVGKDIGSTITDGEVQLKIVNFETRTNAPFTDDGDCYAVNRRLWFHDGDDLCGIVHNKKRTSNFNGTITPTTTHVSLGLTVEGRSLRTGTTMCCRIAGFANTSGCTGTPWIDLRWDPNNSPIGGSQIVRCNLPITSFVEFVLECWATNQITNIQIMGRTMTSTGVIALQSVGIAAPIDPQVGEFHITGDSGTGGNYTYTIVHASVDIG